MDPCAATEEKKNETKNCEKDMTAEGCAFESLCHSIDNAMLQGVGTV
jgi:hypothetical protein